MSWYCVNLPFLPEQEEEFSLQNYLDGIQSGLLKLRSTQEKSYYDDNKKESLEDSQYGTMFAPLTEIHGKEKLTSSQGGSLVKTFPQQEQTLGEEGWDLMEKSLDYGKNINDLLGKLNLRLYSQRTPVICALKDLSPYSKTLTSWGIMQDGVCLGLGTLKQTTKGIECGYLPTPTTCANQLAPSMMKHKGCRELVEFVKKLPTPTAHNAKEGGYPAEGRRNTTTQGWVVGGKIPPILTEWMMGWPIGWTDLEPLEMDKFQLWQGQHSGYLVGE